MTEYQLLTVHEVAQLLRLTDKAVRHLIKRGDLHATLLGREYRIRKIDVDKMLEPQAK
jgi:excisionase family DNA binding protein